MIGLIMFVVVIPQRCYGYVIHYHCLGEAQIKKSSLGEQIGRVGGNSQNKVL